MTNTIVIPIQNNESKVVKNMPVEIIITEEETSKEVIAKSIFEAIKILLEPTLCKIFKRSLPHFT